MGLPFQECPGYSDAITRAVGDGADPRFGDTIARALAGTAHSELYAVTHPIDQAAVQQDPATGMLSAPFMNELPVLYRTMTLGALGYRHLLVAHVELFGWPKPELGEVVEETLRVLGDRLPEIGPS